jgi:integrase
LKDPDAAYVFPGRRRGRHLTTLRYIVEAASAAAQVTDIDVHDLRRTARSIIGDTGTPAKYASLVTAHTTGTGMSAVYDRADEPLARLAFTLLADAIDAAVAGEPMPQWADRVADLHKMKKESKRG